MLLLDIKTDMLNTSNDTWYGNLPKYPANSPIIGISIHGLRLRLRSDQPPANNTITMPKIDSEYHKQNTFNADTQICF